MNRRQLCRIAVLIPVFFFYAAISVTAQNSSELAFEDSRSFYTDLSGHHGLGNATGQSKDEAIRLAKANALEIVFNNIGKDALFQQMFISGWPESIRIEEEKSVKHEDGTYTSKVRVSVDQNAVILTEPKYRENVLNLLNRAEAIIDKADNTIANAQEQEENLRMSEAFSSYRQADTMCVEIQDLLSGINNNSVVSDKGNTKKTIMDIALSMKNKMEKGIARLEQIEKESETTEATQELSRTFNLLERERKNIQQVVEKNRKLSPFYDLPKSTLEEIRIDLNSSLDKLTSQLRERYAVLADTLPQDKVFLREKIKLSRTDLDRLEAKLVKMIDEVTLEIQNPRLERQAKKRRRADFVKAVKTGFAWTFLHRPSEVLNIRWYVPIAATPEKGFTAIEENNFQVSAEKAFTRGIWLRGDLKKNTITFPEGNNNAALIQRVALGFHSGFLFGMGFQWDWIRALDTLAGNQLNKVNSVEIIFGNVDHKTMEAMWLLTLGYTLPKTFEQFIVPYHMNIELDTVLRIEDIIKLEAGLKSASYQHTYASSVTTENLFYQFEWNAGIVLRAPFPFGWGVYHEGDINSLINDLGQADNFGSYRSVWKCFIEYTF